MWLTILADQRKLLKSSRWNLQSRTSLKASKYINRQFLKLTYSAFTLVRALSCCKESCLFHASVWSILFVSCLNPCFLLPFFVLLSFLMSCVPFLHSFLTNVTADWVIKGDNDEIGEHFISSSQMVYFFPPIAKSCLFLRWLLLLWYWASVCVYVFVCVFHGLSADT